jgi:hypothetical protein
VPSFSPAEVNLSEFSSNELAPPVVTGSKSGGNSPCNDSKTWMVKGDEITLSVVVGSESVSPSCNDSMTWRVKNRAIRRLRRQLALEFRVQSLFELTQQKRRFALALEAAARRPVGWCLPWESAYCLAAQSRQARAGEAQEPSSGARGI